MSSVIGGSSGGGHDGRKPTSRSSTGSVASNTSLGIGGAAVLDPNIEAKFVKLRPGGGSNTPTTTTYDCLVLVIVCKQHDKVALCQVDTQIWWFPFVAREGRNWQKVSQDGLCGLLGSKHADGSVLRKPPDPADYKLYSLELVRLQGVSGSSWAERLTQLVLLHNCTNTCEPVNNLVWVDVSELMSKPKNVFWGPEYRYFDDLSRHMSRLEVVELSADPIFRSICSTSTSDLLATLFQSCNLKAEMLCDLYEDYLAHTYPSLYMTLPSFAIYLRKLGFSAGKNEAAVMKAIFRACLHRPKRTNKADFLDFFDVSYAVVAMDPKTPNEQPRIRFLFDYYNKNNDGFLTDKEIDRLAEDNNKAKLSKKMSLHDLQKAIHEGRLPNIDKTCRLPRSAMASLAKAITSKDSNASKVAYKKKSSRPRYVCGTCRVKNFEYGQHCVTIDTLGRCVDPMQILLSESQIEQPAELTGKYLYSMDCSYSTSSVGYIFLDYIRNGKLKFEPAQGDQTNRQFNFYEQFKALCEHVTMLVKHEPKISKRQSPAVIVGDLQGSLDSLLALDVKFWRSMPTHVDDVIFLGNYSGNGAIKGQAIEALVYLLAIKYLCPGKVLLLRGIQETRTYNEKTLLPECKVRFGEELGKQIWESLNGMFEHLPYIAIVNEWVVCISSGIPKDAAKQRLSQLFDNVSQDCATFQQVMTNMPDRSTEHEHLNKAADDVQFKPNPLMPNAFNFSWGAFRKFLELNQFTYMIRSNECMLEGFQICFGRRCITIESNCGNGEDKRKKAVVATVSSKGRIQLAQIHYPQPTAHQ